MENEQNRTQWMNDDFMGPAEVRFPDDQLSSDFEALKIGYSMGIIKE